MVKKESRLPDNPTQKEQLHYNAVLLEAIRSQMSAVIEMVGATRIGLNEKIDGVEKRLTDRLEVVEMVVRKNSEDIRKNSEDIRKNSEDIQSLEKKVDRIVEKVERHDNEIAYLKSVVSQT